MRLAHRLLLTAGLLTAVVAPSLASAQAWPTRPVTMLVPFPAGGPTDLLARAVAEALSDKLGQQVIVENRTGAAGNIAAAAAVKAPKDGYTILFSTPGPITLNKLMSKDLTFDPERELAPIVLIAKSAHVIVANPKGPVKSFQELISYAKANPGKMTVGIPGRGTTGHIAMEYFLKVAGVTATIVPYRGGNPMMTDLIGGQIDVGVDLISSEIPHIQEGSVRGIGLTSLKRSDKVPNVPTLHESGLANFEAVGWFVLAVPTGTPNDVMQKVNGIVNAYVKSDKGKARLADLDLEPAGSTPEEAKAYIAAETAKWDPVIKAADIKM